MTQTLDRERELTEDEIKARTKLRDELDDERDDLGKSIEDRRREIRTFTAKRKKLEAQLRDVRRELRTGTVFESSQLTFPEVPQGESRHGEGELLDPIELRHLISCVRPREGWPTVKEIKGWHPEVRADVQKWCRSEHTRASPIAGAPLPEPTAMPNVLENIIFRHEEKIEAKRKAERAAKSRPSGGARRKPAPRARGRK
jgi:hypothetical protein